jgi:hypothetical protein
MTTTQDANSLRAQALLRFSLRAKRFTGRADPVDLDARQLDGRLSCLNRLQLRRAVTRWIVVRC